MKKIKWVLISITILFFTSALMASQEKKANSKAIVHRAIPPVPAEVRAIEQLAAERFEASAIGLDTYVDEQDNQEQEESPRIEQEREAQREAQRASLRSEQERDAQQEAQRQAERARAESSRPRDKEEALYDHGTRALDQGHWDRAVAVFGQVVELHARRTDGALYWKAYAQNKLGQRTEALAGLAELNKSFPQSRWINDAKALEVEIRSQAGRPVSPSNEGDEDLKLMAINGLLTSDP
ncbi:MAG: tetratricopeptide repeat protein, partial [Terriglobia bacterium]